MCKPVGRGLQASTSVQHLALPCHWSQRPSVAADCIRTYGATGRTIVFTDTKKDANELASTLEALGARALHGDIPQSQREVTPELVTVLGHCQEDSQIRASALSRVSTPQWCGHHVKSGNQHFASSSIVVL